ncbi:TlpA family protein disulfide reductase [Aquimarina brevivitae]|uniref:Thiol-disulfide isomerase/thioredoxin n=1 Tax=Aquimarina brevivitae TaxID=323412 RepID=A0A4Q7NW14_9FLAO|nr:TlpA disulfide reductase family protein [Aquimarina brevivitae]RZS90592.1 thiol-disulfide isomerase/thioredoxin [Aquimarina brevivitae]
MKQITLVFFFLTFISQAQKEDAKILQETVQKLNDLTTVEYKSIVDFYPSMKEGDGHYEATCYFDFTSDDQLVGAKYVAYADEWQHVYNGKSIFRIIEKDKRVIYENKPRLHHLGGSIYIGGSLLETKIMLPKILNDETIQRTPRKDTLIDQQAAYKFEFRLPNQYIAYFKLEPATIHKDYVCTYELFINKKTMLPVMVRTSNSEGNQVIVSRIEDIKFDTKQAEEIWTMDRLEGDYFMISEREFYGQQESTMRGWVNKTAPGFNLPNLEGSFTNLGLLEDKVILLEFWFRGCGPCMKAYPEIEKIRDTYADQGLGVYGIEFITPHKDKQKLKDYVEKYNMTIPTIYRGQGVAKTWGVVGAPTFFVLDSDKKIVYAKTGFRQEELISTIEAELNK